MECEDTVRIPSVGGGGGGGGGVPDNVFCCFFFSRIVYFTEDRTDPPREAIGPRTWVQLLHEGGPYLNF